MWLQFSADALIYVSQLPAPSHRADRRAVPSLVLALPPLTYAGFFEQGGFFLKNPSNVDPSLHPKPDPLFKVLSTWAPCFLKLPDGGFALILCPGLW